MENKGIISKVCVFLFVVVTISFHFWTSFAEKKERNTPKNFVFNDYEAFERKKKHKKQQKKNKNNTQYMLSQKEYNHT